MSVVGVSVVGVSVGVEVDPLLGYFASCYPALRVGPGTRRGCAISWDLGVLVPVRDSCYKEPAGCVVVVVREPVSDPEQAVDPFERSVQCSSAEGGRPRSTPRR